MGRDPSQPLLNDDLPVQDKDGVAYNDYWYVYGYERDPVPLVQHARRVLYKGNVTLQYISKDHTYVAQYAEDLRDRSEEHDWTYWSEWISGDDVFPTKEAADQARIVRLRDASTRAYGEFCRIEQLRKKLGD